MAMFGYDDVVLDPHAAFAQAVEPGLHRKYHTFFQLGTVSTHDLRSFVHVQPQTVASFVAGKFGKLRPFEHLLDQIVHIMRCNSRPRHLSPTGIGGKDGFVEPAVPI